MRSSTRNTPVSLTLQELTPARERKVAEVDPSFALELVEASDLLFDGLSPRLREDLCLVAVAESKNFSTLSEVVIKDGPLGPLRNELALLRFAVVLASASKPERIHRCAYARPDPA